MYEPPLVLCKYENLNPFIYFKSATTIPTRAEIKIYESFDFKNTRIKKDIIFSIFKVPLLPGTLYVAAVREKEASFFYFLIRLPLKYIFRKMSVYVCVLMYMKWKNGFPKLFRYMFSLTLARAFRCNLMEEKR